MIESMGIYENYLNPTEKPPHAVELILKQEEHYMKLLREYRGEIDFISQLIEHQRNEITKFYMEDWGDIVNKINALPVDDQMKKSSLQYIEESMKDSFLLSERVMNGFVVKKKDEFMAKLKEKMNEL